MFSDSELTEKDITGQSKKRGRLLAGNFFSPNIERTKTRQTTLGSGRDALNTYQQRLQRFATLENQDPVQRSGSRPSENQDRNSQRHEVWSGTQILNTPITSTRSKPLAKPVSPQLAKSPADFGASKDKETNDTSYIRRVKQALLERSEKQNEELRMSPKVKENIDMLNFKKLKNITSGMQMNMFVSNTILGSNTLMTDELNKSATGKSKKRPLQPRDLNSGRGLASGSADVLLQKQNDNDISRSSVNSRDRSASRTTAQKQMKTLAGQDEDSKITKAEQESTAEKLVEIVPDQVKSSRLKSLANLEEIVYNIYNLISQDRDPYECIRQYSDLAQDNQFNYLENMLKFKSMKTLYSRLMKVERWLIVYLFYFTIQEEDRDRHKLAMLEICDILYKNMSFLVAWTSRLDSKVSFKNISIQVQVSQYSSSRFVEAANLHIKSAAQKLNQIASGISKTAVDSLAAFCEKMDKWSVNKAFEKGFESFYEAFIAKGVISVSYQDKENSGGQQEKAPAQPVNPTDSLLETNFSKETPQKAQLMPRRMEEIPTERKSFGDKLIIQELRDLDGPYVGSVHIDKMDSPFFLFQPDTQKVKQKKALIPPIRSDREYTLVLDLDETLIHFDENPDGTSQFLIRPYAQSFLKEVSKCYELIIFTAALKDYADFILDRLDTEGCISHRLYRYHCSFSENVYHKDLSKIGRPLDKILIVDNNAENFQQQPDNGIYIKSWYNDPNDEALKRLTPLLTDIVHKQYSDVRVALKKYKEKMMRKLKEDRRLMSDFTLSIERPPGIDKD